MSDSIYLTVCKILSFSQRDWKKLGAFTRIN